MAKIAATKSLQQVSKKQLREIIQLAVAREQAARTSAPGNENASNPSGAMDPAGVLCVWKAQRDVDEASPRLTLDDAIKNLPAAARSELFVLAQIGKGALEPHDWNRGLYNAARMTDGEITALLLNDPQLHAHLTKIPLQPAPQRGEKAKRKAIASAFLANASFAFLILGIAAGKSPLAALLVPIQFLICTVLGGIAFAWIYERLYGPAWVRGVTFALGIWLFEMAVFLPLAGAGFYGINFGNRVVIPSAISLALYGLILGSVFGYLSRHDRWVRRLIGSGVVVLIIFIVVRSFIIQPFNMADSGAEPTLLTGDYFYVLKYPYGFSRYSLPFSPPLLTGRILPSLPQRGDLVVSRLPKHANFDQISRIVGLPGDRIQMINGALYLNGNPVKRERVSNFNEETEQGDRTMPVKQWRETMPNGATYNTLDLIDRGFADNTAIYRVPPGSYFLLGDNRDNSTDSRFPRVGYVPFEYIVGKVGYILFSVRAGAHAWEFWRWPQAVRWNRVFTSVH